MLLDLFITFFKLGLFTFGGGYAMISNIKEIIVEKKQWITEDELIEMITIAESTPGPIAINMATYVGYHKAKILGSILSTLGVVLPSFIIIFIISLFLEQFMTIKYVQYAFYGINACVSFLICRTGFNLVKKIEKKKLPIITFIIVFTLLMLFEILSISFSSILFIIFGGLLGIIYYGVITGKGGSK
ncbi:MAG: chromate transporter [Bacilli bacterium]|nr:chromate transporter [Bacilli bacterium]